jgi:hypothetical protein
MKLSVTACPEDPVLVPEQYSTVALTDWMKTSWITKRSIKTFAKEATELKVVFILSDSKNCRRCRLRNERELELELRLDLAVLLELRLSDEGCES